MQSTNIILPKTLNAKAICFSTNVIHVTMAWVYNSTEVIFTIMESNSLFLQAHDYHYYFQLMSLCK